ncbi:MAG: biotin--[acetyl-CoA-carboxylase] ligase [Endomicrobium sp.]|jgi:BirA family biotin operon repressor/biotin-[acetyl-CoA-carboxylase] ligase|nr:biotin--[acetyl-CoA-carboxylase] ligase [Endomicrobium sp.]
MRILETLFHDKYVSGNEIASALKISRAAVHKQVNALRKNGYVILSSKKGYMLSKKADILDESEIKSFFDKPLSIAKKIICLKTADSTQTQLRRLAENSDAAEGIVLTAETQSEGYGRRKRKWSSNKGGLWFSFLLMPEMTPENASKLALVICAAVNRFFEKNYNFDLKIKWPNDLLYKNKKLAGILVEMSAEHDRINWIIAGIGINVSNILPESLQKESVSLKEILKTGVNRSQLLAGLLSEIEISYALFKKEGFGVFADEYNRKAAFINEPVAIDDGKRQLKGIDLGVDENGFLLLKTKNGVEKIVSGTLRKI